MTQVDSSRKRNLLPLVAMKFDLWPPRQIAMIRAELR
jgi:hypothetical protein